jgi:Subtilisin inhibitor-like
VVATALVSAALAITVYPNGTGRQPVHRYTLRCDPAAGSVPNPARACGALAALENPFAPIPPDTACTQIAGGPQEARVVGRVGDAKIWVRLRLRNGCEIDRWRKLAAVVPGFRGP